MALLILIRRFLREPLNIPAVIGLGGALKEEYDGKVAIVDGVDGKVYIDPDEETMASMRKEAEEKYPGTERTSESARKAKRM